MEEPLSIAVVDESNRFVRWERKTEVHRLRLFHRSVHIVLFDSRGRLVIQQRHPQKLTYPAHWDGSCAGHVERPDYPGGPDEGLDAVYLSVAQRELQEELGISAPLSFVEARGPEKGLHYEHFQLFEGTHDGPYIIQLEEVHAVKAVTAAEFDAMASDGSVLMTPLLRRTVSQLRGQGRFLA